jgi:gamma-glutamylcyclotransferase (GGCT)/AIG2-like uncharacterized protein YtfP
VFRGLASTEPRFRLVDCGGFPGLVESDSGGAVRGELWEVSEELLPVLDAYEGVVEGEYVRLPVPLASPSPNATVWAYHYAWEADAEQESGNGMD